MNGPCDFHNHPSYADVVDAARTFVALSVIYRTHGRPSSDMRKRVEKAHRTLERASCPPLTPGDVS